ncbi:histone H2A.Z-specific chaperone CHZ1 [Aspergillus clavatus NRRL 1]|uniref:histone H2A.Z-specific chaperone CHZ1 n=1 Tax=Aspergillus clavatus (strain ATCC 1007 / CBS 513.65 / DSM 816 / NCTC 3887 / NRRL 1 / QM 1276 / 107) TaxID=344612 RepID=UPI0000EA5991|nr:uncharacterized protein ACLA_027180 [Aspergillus clavatus NRRL 1]EAW07996.1 conserved hypothetical protein [Aspergillus clavatus NRRL 1]
MGDNNRATFSNDPAANAPDAAAVEKGKGKAVEEPALEMSMDEDEESEESEAEEIESSHANASLFTEDDEDDHDNLEPISQSNIIAGGRRTRGKTIDFQEAAEKLKDEMDEDDDDEDFEPNDNDMRN